jgi:hypothetical protein
MLGCIRRWELAVAWSFLGRIGLGLATMESHAQATRGEESVREAKTVLQDTLSRGLI